MASLNPDPWRVTAAPPPASPRAGSRSYTYTSPPTCAASSCAGSAAPTSAESNANTSAAEPLAERASPPPTPAPDPPRGRAPAAPGGRRIAHRVRLSRTVGIDRTSRARGRGRAARARATARDRHPNEFEADERARRMHGRRIDEFVRLHRFPLLARATREARSTIALDSHPLDSPARLSPRPRIPRPLPELLFPSHGPLPLIQRRRASALRRFAFASAASDPGFDPAVFSVAASALFGAP